MTNNSIGKLVFLVLNKYARYTEKQIIINVQATPNTQPGGVQGAWFKLIYQSVNGPLSINQLPIANPLKLIIKNNTKALNIFILDT